MYSGKFLLAAAAALAVSATPIHHENEFTIRSETLFPVQGYVYIGDGGPACTDQTANMLRYRGDHSLEVCTGHDKGWVPMRVLPKVGAP